MEHNYPLKPRYYPTIDDLVSEDERDISSEGMQRRCTGISMLQDYMELPVSPQLMPSADAPLKGLVLTVPDYAFNGNENPIREIYHDLLLKLPATTTFYMIVHAQVKEALNNWLKENNMKDRVKIHVAPDRYEMTIWAEDGFEIVKDSHSDQLYLVHPHSHRRTFDGNIGYLLSKGFNWRQVKVPVYFEGGNMLVGDDFVLLGIDHAIDTYHYLGKDLLKENTSPATIVTDLFRKYLDHTRRFYFVGCTMQLLPQQERKFRLQDEEWTEIIYMKNQEGTMQPIFHIDMFITLAGRNSEGKYQLVVADTRAAAEQLGMPELQLVMPDTFDEIAENLQRLGFEIYRNPLPLVYIDEPEKKVRQWYFASYNNALVEIKPDGAKTIWLPTYGHGNWKELEKTDQENKHVWEELGFEVVLLKDFHPFVENAGAVHCIKKYIRKL